MKTYAIFTYTALMLTLTACGASEVQRQTSSIVPKAQAAAKEVLTGSNKGQYMKPGAPVQMSYTSEKIASGQISNIQATLHLTSSGVEQVHVDINVDEGIVLHGSPGLSFDLPLKAGQLDYPLSISASSVNTGLSYINVMVTTTQNGSQQTRALSIPVQVGSDAEIQKQKQANSRVEYDAEGNPVLPMQAEETIH